MSAARQSVFLLLDGRYKSIIFHGIVNTLEFAGPADAVMSQGAWAILVLQTVVKQPARAPRAYITRLCIGTDHHVTAERTLDYTEHALPIHRIHLTIKRNSGNQTHDWRLETGRSR